MNGNYTSRMATLLGRLRREMNGAVSESMTRGGIKGLLNYGVSLPTIVDIASSQQKDYDFAKFLYRQQVREIRISATIIAPAEQLPPADLPFWLGGAVSYEIADIVAMNLISKSPCLDELKGWLSGEDAMAAYLALKSYISAREILPQESVVNLLYRFGDNQMIARAVVAYFLNVEGAAPSVSVDTATPAAEYFLQEIEAFFDL